MAIEITDDTVIKLSDDPIHQGQHLLAGAIIIGAKVTFE
jgi:hypothetical protein